MTSRNITWSAWLLSLAFVISAGEVRAQGPKTVKATAEPVSQTSAEKEKSALAFASEHHADLANLLKHLKSSNR